MADARPSPPDGDAHGFCRITPSAAFLLLFKNIWLYYLLLPEHYYPSITPFPVVGAVRLSRGPLLVCFVDTGSP